MSRGLWILVLSVLSSLALLALQATAGAVQASHRRDPAEERDYEETLAAIDPSLAPAFHAATEAMDAQRLDEARAGYEKIVARAPKHAPTLRRLSHVLREQGQIEEAVATARRAREAGPGAYSDYALAAALLSMKSSPSAREEAGDIQETLLNGAHDEKTAEMAGTIAMGRGDLAGIGRAIAVLERVAPQSTSLHFLTAIEAFAKGELGTAEAALARAEAAGLDPAFAAELREKGGLNRRESQWTVARGVLIGLGVWLLGFLVIYVVGRAMSARALSAIERLAPDRSNALVDATLRLRRAYGAAVRFAAAYYFISIPIVLALVLALGGGVILGLLWLEWIPIKLFFLVVLAVLATAWALVRSFFVRRGPDADPGTRLTEGEAPDLWAVLREVAREVGTRPVDDVFVTPGTEVGVTERGTMTERLRDRGRRFLVLGVGVLDGMTERQLRAVLAHEYGHFSHRDTARGDLAGTVRASLITTVIRLAQGGGLLAINPAWHFLRLYCALFERVALGASRLQEVLADRFAAVTYGGPALIEGLTHVIRRTVEFDAGAEATISRAQGERRAIANLYSAPPPDAVNSIDVGAALERAMTDAGSPYDSHPPVAKRIAWLTAFGAAAGEGLTSTSDGPAWDLIADRSALEGRMTAIVNERLEAAGHIDVPVPDAVASPLSQRA